MLFKVTLNNKDNSNLIVIVQANNARIAMIETLQQANKMLAITSITAEHLHTDELLIVDKGKY